MSNMLGDRDRDVLERWRVSLRQIAHAEQRMSATGYQAFPAWKRACRTARRLANPARIARGLPPLPAVPRSGLALAWGGGFLAGAVLAALVAFIALS